MPLTAFQCTNFRCLADAGFEPHAEFTLITGPNASGKTSLLEALAFLGRGRSFRGAMARDMVRHGERNFVLTGRVAVEGRLCRVGIQHGGDGLQQSIDGDRDGGLAELAAILPLQVIDPAVHELVGGGPEHRRRFLDWMAFHVEHGFLESWRRFRRALKQRNAALRTGGRGVSAWDKEFTETALAVDRHRRALLDRALPTLEGMSRELLAEAVQLEYAPGWTPGRSLEEALADGATRDREGGTSHYGPHRAELKLRMDDRLARRLVSRGQQKLLACALILGSVRVVAQAAGRVPLLLVDDPAAELDRDSLARLMAAIAGLGGQVIATALTPDALPLPAARSVFHVERGTLQPGG